METYSTLTDRKWSHSQWYQRVQRFSYARIVFMLCGLALFLASCGGSGSISSATTQVTVPPLTPAITSTPVPTPTLPTITLQVVNCPSGLSINWDKLIGTTPRVNKVQKIMCGSLEGPGSLEALVNVRYYSPDMRLDYYVYDNLTGTPFQRFSGKGLLFGDAQISSVNTITTAEMEPKDLLQGNRDLFKEYAWNGTAFVQTIFPGLYPDMTRYQADQAQATVAAEIAASGKGPDTWRLSGLGETSRLAQIIFHWSNYSQQILINDKRDNITRISVTNMGPGGGGFIATLNHLNGNIDNIYEITQISPIEGNVWLSSPTANEELTSPVQISGSTPASGSILGQVLIYDDTYKQVGDSGPIASTVPSGYTQFNTSASYSLNAQGTQEGLVAFYQTSQNNAELSNQIVLVKVLLMA